MTIGPRIWKTGLAVTLALFICEKLHLPSPIFAVIAAIVTMRPSVAQSLKDGWYRIVATVIGGFIGFVIVYYFGSGPFTVGFAVILAIVVCNGLKLQEAVVITGITVGAVMVDIQGSPAIVALQRLQVTVLGIILGIGVNLFFFPPRCERLLLSELKKLNYMLKSYYIYVANGFLQSTGYDEEEVEKRTEDLRKQFEEVRKKLFELKKELGYITSGEKVKTYDRLVSFYYLIFQRIVDIYQTESNRSKRLNNLQEVTPEYEEIIDICRQLLTVTVSMQDSLADFYFAEHQKDLYDFVSSCSKQSDILVKKLREKISQWHLLAENQEKSLSLLEISNIGYEMEQIYRYFNEISLIYSKLAELEDKKPKINRIFKFKTRKKGN